MSNRLKAILVLLISILLLTLFVSRGEVPNEKYCVVTYIVDEKVYSSETVLYETLAHLPTDVTSSQTTLPFLCWCEEGTLTPFLKSTLITSDITLVAHFSENNTITFINNQGSEMDVVEYSSSQVTKKREYDQPLPLNNIFSYWYLKEYSDAPFEFGKTLTENIILYPKVLARNAAIFITGVGGSEIDPQCEETSFYAVDPISLGIEVSRPGYSFVRWSAQEGGDETFDFEGTSITGMINIYAVWKAEMTGYSIDFWNEKVDIDDPGDPADPANKENYELVYSKYITQGAISGLDLTVSEEVANLLYPSGGTEVLKLLNYSDFAYSETKTISGDGATVINVYYKRTVYEYNFDPRNIGKWTSSGTIYVPSAYIILRDGTQYGGTKEDGASGLPLPYTIHVKLGQNIKELWPVQTARTDNAAVFQNWNGYYSNGAETINVGHISFAMTNNNDNMIKPTKTSANLGIDSKNWLTKYYTEIRKYYIQNLNDNPDIPETVAFTTKTTQRPYEDSGKTHYYTLASTGVLTYQSGNPLTSAIGWPGRDIPGFITITATNTDKINHLTQYYQEVLPYTPTDKVNYYINYYMLRKSYTLTLKTNGGVLNNYIDFEKMQGTDDAKKVLQYEAPLGVLPSPMLEGHEFIGWYLDDALTIPCNLTIMPSIDLTLYAKYKGEVTYVNYYEDNTKIKTNEYERGYFITSHDLSDTSYADYEIGENIPGKGIFKGWYYEKGSKKVFVTFPLEVSLTCESYDLYASWQEVDYKISYMLEDIPGSGKFYEYCTQSIHSGSYNTLALSGLYELVPPARQYYYFLGWNTNPDGLGEEFTASKRITEDVVVYAMWEFAIPFTFTKVDGKDMSTPLEGAEFTMYSCSHMHDEECGGLDNPADCTHQHDDLVSKYSCWTLATGFTNPVISGEDGIIKFSYLTEGVYQLVETKAPTGYQLILGQWRLTVSLKNANILEIKAMGEELPPEFILQDEFTYLLVNEKEPIVIVVCIIIIVFFTFDFVLFISLVLFMYRPIICRRKLVKRRRCKSKE